MPFIHIVSRSYHDPRFEELTVNRGRFYGVNAATAVALMRSTAAPFEKVELAWSEEITQEEERQIMKSFEQMEKLKP